MGRVPETAPKKDSVPESFNDVVTGVDESSVPMAAVVASGVPARPSGPPVSVGPW